MTSLFAFVWAVYSAAYAEDLVSLLGTVWESYCEIASSLLMRSRNAQDGMIKTESYFNPPSSTTTCHTYVFTDKHKTPEELPGTKKLDSRVVPYVPT